MTEVQAVLTFVEHTGFLKLNVGNILIAKNCSFITRI